VTRPSQPPIVRLDAAFRSGLPIVTCEIAAGDGADPDDVLRRARLVRDHVDAVNIPDNTAGVVHMAAWAASILLAREGVDPIMHVTCRDRNRLALQSDLLGAAALGVRNVLCLTGDHMVHGDHPGAKPVFDLDSLQLLGLADVLRHGRYLSGREIKPAPELFLGATENPFAPPYDFRPLRLQKKGVLSASFWPPGPEILPVGFPQNPACETDRIQDQDQPLEASKADENAYPSFFCPSAQQSAMPSPLLPL
jgi:methylenetetrahydrofolate reductase (NADPH)